MSYGALSDRAILALSSGAKLGGFSHNTGEGGISDFHKEGGADLVWNLGTAYFGAGKFGDGGVRVFDPDLFVENSKFAKMIEIKLSQGAKPAHGGMLPKNKVSEAIAKARNLEYPVLEDCHSPPRHGAFSNPVEMCHFIQQLRSLSDGKPIGIKLCLGQPEEFCEMVKAFVETGIHPDFITVDGAEGGTGAAPPEFSNSVGTPLVEGLTFIHSVLVGAGLRNPVDKSKSKIALIASGKVLTGFSMYKNFALGADVCNAARSFLFSLGCIQALKCNTNTCPTGITTQDPELSWGLVSTISSRFSTAVSCPGTIFYFSSLGSGSTLQKGSSGQLSKGYRGCMCRTDTGNRSNILGHYTTSSCTTSCRFGCV
jgi:glutamate synthase domain-containing protein 2